MEQTIKDFVLLLGGWTVIITAIISFISYLTTQKIIKSWDYNNQREFELLRNRQEEMQLLLKDSSSSLSSSQSLLQEKRIASVDRLWTAIMEMKRHFSPVTFFFAIIMPDDYKTAINNPKFMETLRKVDQEYIAKVLDEIDELENLRLYLGDTLWLYFFVYRAILGRLAIMVNWIKDGKDVRDWRDDKGIQQHLREVFENDEYDHFIKMSPLDIYYVLNAMDSKVLREISVILSGRKSILESYENSKELRKMLSNEKL